jgi:DNA-binding transcriptional ArsR family regulator
MATERRSKQLRADVGHHPLRKPKAIAQPRKPQDRIQRFLKMIRLLAGGQELAARQLSAECDVTERTILRDMKVLEEAGLVIRPGSRHRSGYRLAPQAAWERPQLSLAEVLALLTLAERAAEDDAGDPAIVQQAVLKLIRMQPYDVRIQLESLVLQFEGEDVAPRAWLCRQPWLPLLVQALVHHTPLRVWLKTQSDDPSAAPLVIVPAAIAAHDGAWLLCGYEVSGSDIMVELEEVAMIEKDVQ